MRVLNACNDKKRNAEKLPFATILLLSKKDFQYYSAPFRGFLFYREV